MAGRFKEVLKKYGKVGIAVHCSVSAASITGLYVAIKNNVDVESVLEKVGMQGVLRKKEAELANTPPEDAETTKGPVLNEYDPTADKGRLRNRTADLAATSGGALALAILVNKALFPVRVPITLALTPPLARFLARRKLIKTN